MNKKTFYITTPIYYPSANPHVGTAYTTVLADVLKRNKQLLGYDVFLTTGTDEHALKIYNNAKKENKTPLQFVDEKVANFKELWKQLDISYDAFIRTTAKQHEDVVKQVYKKFYDLNLLKQKTWSGWYCNSCEESYALNNIVNDNGVLKCNQNHELVQKDEQSLFFETSKFNGWINDFLTVQNPQFIEPIERRNELINSFIKNGLEDLSVTRINSNWGIPVLVDYFQPDGKNYVAYVWVDALFSYLSALNFLQPDDSNFQKYWQNENSEVIHLMSKEITRFHAIYWPIFLNVLNLKQPSKIISHGWIIIKKDNEIQKMSKSLGNVIDPYYYINKYGSDALRFFFVKGLILDNDNEFTESRFIEVYNTYLANSFGNLSTRVLAMLKKYFDATVPALQKPVFYVSMYDALNKHIENIKQAIFENYSDEVINELFTLNQSINNLIENEKPWDLFKQNQTEQLKELLHYLTYCTVVTYYFLSSVLVKASPIVLKAYGFDLQKLHFEEIQDLTIINNKKIGSLNILFKRIDLNK